jgi:hypothetical protein
MDFCADYCTAPICSRRDDHNILSHQHNGEYGVIKGVIVPIPINKQCSILDCEHKDTHTNQGHQCRVCDTSSRSLGHSFQECHLFCINKTRALAQGK